MVTLLTKEEVAKKLDRTTRTITQWIKEGYFPKGQYIKRRPFWTEKQIDTWIKSRPQ